MQSNLTLAKKAISLFRHDMADKTTCHHNARAWLRSIEILGDNWVIKTPINNTNKGNIQKGL